MARSNLSYTLRDYTKESAVVVIPAVEYSALTYPAYLTDIGLFRVAAFGNGDKGICWNTLVQEKQTLFVDDFSAVPPVDESMLRGRKWVIRYQDTTTFQKYRLEIPCAKVTNLTLPNSEKADMARQEWVNFKVAFEEIVRSNDGHSVVMLGAYLVGRKL